jgi:hypothetical protein
MGTLDRNLGHRTVGARLPRPVAVLVTASLLMFGTFGAPPTTDAATAWAGQPISLPDDAWEPSSIAIRADGSFVVAAVRSDMVPERQDPSSTYAVAEHVVVATGRPGAWEIQELPDSARFVSEVKVALGRGNDIIVTYDGTIGDTTETRGFFATNHGGTWSVTTIDVVTDGSINKVVIDRAGAAHLVVLRRGLDTDPLDIWYVTNASGAWVARRLGTAGDGLVFGSPSLAIDTRGRVHVAYSRTFEWEHSEIYYVTNAGGSWKTQRVTRQPLRTYDPILAVDAKGYAHIAYLSDAGGVSGGGSDSWALYLASPSMHYATNATGKWVISAPAGINRTSRGAYRDDRGAILALDSAGAPHIVIARGDLTPGIRSSSLWESVRVRGRWVTSRMTKAVATSDVDIYSSAAMGSRIGVLARTQTDGRPSTWDLYSRR